MTDIRKNIDSSRIYYLDFMRGLAIFFMIMQHAVLMHEINAGEVGSTIGSIFILLGTAPAAPIFLLIMGIFIGKSNKNSSKLVKRGIKLFALGYILNFFRFYWPIVLAGESFLSKEAISLLLSVDILQVAGLTFMVAGIFKRQLKHKYNIPIICLGILLVSPYLWGLMGKAYIFDPLWGIGDNIAFPLFPWIVYPLLGMYLSKYLLSNKLASKVKKGLLLYGTILGVVGLITLEMFPYEDYSRYGLGASLLVISFVLLWTLVSNMFINSIKSVKDSRILKTLFFWSENVTNIYIVQWLIYGVSMLILGVNMLSDYASVAFGICVVIIAHILIKHTNIKKILPRV